MSLTPIYPNQFSGVYSPIILRLDSDVTDQFTIGTVKAIDTVTNNLGFAQLHFTSAHGLLKGDYILITSAPGAENIIGVALVKSIVDTTTLVINLPYPGPLSSNGEVYRYLNNYNAVVYVYVNTQTSNDNLVAVLTIKPKFEGGFCVFTADLSVILQSFSDEGNDPGDVMDKNLFPIDSNPFGMVNSRSFIIYYIKYAEAYDNPVNGNATYQPTNPVE